MALEYGFWLGPKKTGLPERVVPVVPGTPRPAADSDARIPAEIA
jgi:hypothetical protein